MTTATLVERPSGVIEVGQVNLDRFEEATGLFVRVFVKAALRYAGVREHAITDQLVEECSLELARRSTLRPSLFRRACDLQKDGRPHLCAEVHAIVRAMGVSCGLSHCGRCSRLAQCPHFYNEFIA